MEKAGGAIGELVLQWGTGQIHAATLHLSSEPIALQPKFHFHNLLDAIFFCPELSHPPLHGSPHQSSWEAAIHDTLRRTALWRAPLLHHNWHVGEFSSSMKMGRPKSEQHAMIKEFEAALDLTML